MHGPVGGYDRGGGCEGCCGASDNIHVHTTVSSSIWDHGVRTLTTVRSDTKEAALEFAKDNIRVNSIHPGAIDTDMIRDAYGVERVSEYLQLIPLGRMGTSEDIAKGVMFLASDDSSYITGAELTIDGGILIK